MSHYIIIGQDSGPDYAKFGVNDPMPIFSPKYSFERDGQGRAILQVLTIQLTECYFLGATSALFTAFDNLKAWLQGGTTVSGFSNPSGPKNFRLFDSGDNLLFSALTTDFDNSPIYEDVEIAATDGGWTGHIKFNMTVRCLKAIMVADFGNDGVRDIVYNKTTNKRNGRDEVTIQVSATGDNAQTWCEGKRPGENEGIISEETHVEDFVANSFAITYLLNKEGAGVAGKGVVAFRESITGSGGGNPLFYLVATRRPPTKFVGQKTPFILTYSGEVRATRLSGLIYPNRNGLDFKDGNDETSVVIEEKKANGLPAIYRGTWVQRFVFPEAQNFVNNAAKYRIHFKPGDGFQEFDLAGAIIL